MTGEGSVFATVAETTAASDKAAIVRGRARRPRPRRGRGEWSSDWSNNGPRCEPSGADLGGAGEAGGDGDGGQRGADGGVDDAQQREGELRRRRWLLGYNCV